MISVLVTGSDSQLAQCIKDIEKDYSQISFTYKNSKELDITNNTSIKETFVSNKIQYCINCAAYTNVDQAEIEQEKAYNINSIGPKNLAKQCKDNDVTLIHLSTDFVFDGKKKTPYLETDKPNPINVYGLSKLKGELAIQEQLSNYFIIRTSWLYSPYKKNFVKTILNIVNTKDVISVVNDQFGCPTSAIDLAGFICSIIQRNIIAYGIYHYSNVGKISWYDFAKEIISLAKSKAHLEPIKSDFYKCLAKRPLFSVLDISKVNAIVPDDIKNWRESLQLSYKSNSLQYKV